MILRGAARADFLLEETLYEIFAKSASLFPQKTVLQCGEASLTYQQLMDSSDAAGQALAALGAGPGAILGLWMPRGLGLIQAQTAITASGAGWLPFDAEVPIERAAVCLEAAGAIGIITVRAWKERLASLPVPVWCLEDLLALETPRIPTKRPGPADPAYVIYTSGSTGTPKGITISQSNICHFLRSENAVLGIGPDDLVYQGFSVAFDMSLEEIWISFLAGASLWIAPPEMVADPDAISSALERHQITVLHAVPTLVALIERLPTHLRLINIGGEACPEALAQRLTGKGRRIFNTYGPTETTVTASVAELLPGVPVTIGTPLPNYGMMVLDAQRQPLPPGETGEIAVFGPGVSPGYLHLPELTASRFLPNPHAQAPWEARLYLTGDLGFISANGNIHCLGRVDHQVKIRGFRIELDEVAAALARQPAVGTAAAVVRELYGSEEIVAFAVTNSPSLGVETLKEALRAELPAYMVPAHIEILGEIPRLVSGKIDLGSLRKLELSLDGATGSSSDNDARFEPATPALAALWKALSALFPGRRFLPEQDFFCDLGGHSLLAARLVSLLRKDPAYASAGVQHIYKNRVLSKIGAALALLETGNQQPVTPHLPPPLWRRFLCGTAQLICLPFLTLLDLVQWLAPFFAYHALTGNTADSIPRAMVASVLVYLLAVALFFPLTVLLRRILTGGLKPGDYPLWGITYFRWWLGTQLSNASAGHLISGTPWKALHLRILGAKVAHNTMLNSLTAAVPELIEIGEGACIGTFVNIENARVEGGRFIVGRVRIGRNATIDSYSILENDTEVGANARLCGQSTLAAGQRIPEGEVWSGAPACQIHHAAAPWAPAKPPGVFHKLGAMLYYAIGGALVAVIFFMPTFPAFVLIDWIDAHTLDLFESSASWWEALPFFFFMSIPAAMVLVTATMLIVGGLVFLLPRQKPGRFPLHGRVYLHKWMLSTILDTSLQVLHGLYASVFTSSWLRLLGAKVGKETEVSTAEGVIPQLLELGEGSFIADGALLGDEEQRQGYMQLQGTRIGSRSFVGNGAYVPDGAVFPDDVLLGVQSSAPPNEMLAPGQTWMGSPPMLLPARETIETPDPTLTFNPPLYRRLIRGAIESVRIVLPLAFIISAGYVIVYKVMDFSDVRDWRGTAVALLVSSLLYAGSSFVVVWALKWLLIGRYKKRQAPMWTAFVWLSEAITVAHESLAVPALLDHLRGTPFLPWAFRLLGARIGRGTWINTTDLTEFDCVTIGDFAELNAHCGPQTHLFEDRVMRVGEAKIGVGATLGVRTIVLYDASVGDYCRLGPMTLVAKGEHLPPCSRWEGSPATQASNP